MQDPYSLPAYGVVMEGKSKRIAISEIHGSIDVTDICSTFCPYLATDYDGITPMAIPHPSNHCFRDGKAKAKDLSYQREYCLSAEYESCLTYQGIEKAEPAPVVINSAPSKSRSFRYAIPVIVAILLFVALISLPVFALASDQEQGAKLSLIGHVRQLMLDEEQRNQTDATAPGPAIDAPDFASGEAGPADANQSTGQASGNFRAIQYPPGG